ncbi:hypothetical protein QJ527_02600 [Enterococcus mundtii]|uniref:hypothetical protein n=1 Tax=Enterococcus TaxID=1350 RepID=UPI00044A2C1E|nr:hypothetical protein [Enterococcus mundtii]AZP93302.1 hypothetical protein CYK55_09490 [Enterococcus mundtii]EYT96690.1 hypothetical protein AK89_02315 [Enterococcus mundtii CRL35]MDA9430027.1 hypothetical protein [Enterococcus mundtii 1A]MDK4210437.1 hypothetical protein [Enterococcus mundtii]MDO7879136.1 hypothetical protein [Enterococcus mundtii]
MGTVEKQHKLQNLEEQFYQNKRQIHRQQEEINHQLVNFRRETDQLVQKIMYLTKNEHWDSRQFYHQMEAIDRNLIHTAQNYARQLEEKEQELTSSYRKEIERIHETDY